MHVHVAVGEGVAKFWLEPIVALAVFYKVPTADLRRIEAIVKERENDFKSAWRQHFLQ